MRTGLDHLPLAKQRELARVVEVLHAEFADAVNTASSKWKKEGRILKIVLFGSYARGGWVDEPHTAKGYLSDYDLLIVVNYDRVVEFSEYWYKAEDRLMREPAIKTPVNFIVHTLADVNDKLKKGQYFFSDIVKDGIALYNLKGEKPFATPQPLSPKDALEIARNYYDRWMPTVQNYSVLAEDALNRGMRNERAFLLHQSVERAYTGLLLVLTSYSPSTHNVKFLRSLGEELDPSLIDVWPRETKHDRRCFELLKRAYVEARYSEHYKITDDELGWLNDRAQILADRINAACRERLAALAEKAGV